MCREGPTLQMLVGLALFGLNSLRQVVEGINRESDAGPIPVIVFTKGGGLWFEELADLGCDALGVDWTLSLDSARKRVGDRVALQGNLDPATLYANPAAIREQVGAALKSFGHGPGHVFNLGHGLQPGMDPEHVGACVQAVHELSPQYHV